MTREVSNLNRDGTLLSSHNFQIFVSETRLSVLTNPSLGSRRRMIDVLRPVIEGERHRLEGVNIYYMFSWRKYPDKILDSVRHIS